MLSITPHIGLSPNYKADCQVQISALTMTPEWPEPAASPASLSLFTCEVQITMPTSELLLELSEIIHGK